MKKLLIVLMLLIPTLCFADQQQESPKWKVNCTVVQTFATNIMMAYGLLVGPIEERTKAITELVREKVVQSKKATEDQKKKILDDQLYIISDAETTLILLSYNTPTEQDVEDFSNRMGDICKDDLLPSQIQTKGGHYE